MSRRFLSPTDGGVLIKLRVSLNARRSGIEGAYGEDALKVKVAAPPACGRANAETERFLAETLGVRRSEVSVVRGLSGRDKTVHVRGASETALREALRGDRLR